MEFKKEDIVIVDEKKDTIFGSKKPIIEETEDIKAVKEFNRRWMESLSDCA